MNGCLTTGDAIKPEPFAERIRVRTWEFFSDLLAAAQTKLRRQREELRQLDARGQREAKALKPPTDSLDRAALLVDTIAMQLYFASGAFERMNQKAGRRLTSAELQRFWQDAQPLFKALATEPHPHTAHLLVQTLCHLLPCAPREIFPLAAKSILRSSKEAAFQFEPLAVGDVVKLIQRTLADHREIFRSEAGQESECLKALLEVLDRFVEAGWAEARQLTHRLEEINR
jgi:hypothetical protein